ncbi:MAG TPA: hypothetical protein VJ821_13570 [Anaerolineales bacterium]|nr:hypothetical protein [Anaerolineales bacterium]
MLPPPPGVIGSLRAGFDAVSNHWKLILFPFVLDLCLWLGPRLSVEGLLNPYVKFLFNQARNGMTSAVEFQRMAGIQASVMEVLERFNLLSLLSRLLTFPVGVSSLLAETLPVATPYGEQPVVDVSSLPGLIVLIFFLVLIGWVVGGLYFRWVAGTALGDAQREKGISVAWSIVQTLILSVIWFISLVIMMVPVLFVVTILALINSVLANGAVLVMLMLSFWLIIPLFFIPHGIFVHRQNAFHSILSSLRMTRFTLPTSGMFVLSVFLLYRGLNYLWSVPPDNSWMTLVGMAGHAFITTALLAASFVYYRDVNAWVQTVSERVKQKQTVPGRQV